MNNIIINLGAATVKPVDGGSGGDLESAIIPIINGVIGVLGIVCVVVVLIGGINYMTSAGDPGKVKKARDTILYGVIGLIISALAFAIVNFVIVNVLKADPASQAAEYTKAKDCTNAGFKWSGGKCIPK